MKEYGGLSMDFLSSMYCIQHCFICRPTDSTVSEDAVIEPRTVVTSDALTTRLDRILLSTFLDEAFPCCIVTYIDLQC
jgi:hypothetical protein